MAYSNLPKAQTMQGRFGTINPTQDFDAHRRSVWDPTRQTGCCWFIPRSQSHCVRRLTHIIFCKPRLHQWKHCAALDRRTLTWSMIGQIVNIDTENDRGSLAFCDWPNHVHQFGLAVITAVDVVGSVSGAFHFSGVDGRPTQIPFSRQLTTVHFLVTSQTRRYRRNSMGVTCPKNLVGNGSHEGRIGTTTKGRDNLTKVNHDRDELSQLGLQLIRKIQGFEVCHPSIVPRRGAQLLALRSLIHHLKQADSRNHECHARKISRT